jgi:hypothetical protein
MTHSDEVFFQPPTSIFRFEGAHSEIWLWTAACSRQERLSPPAFGSGRSSARDFGGCDTPRPEALLRVVSKCERE